MELEGRLATFPLSDVLKFIEDKAHTGCLSIRLDTNKDPVTAFIFGDSLKETISIRKGCLVGLGSLDHCSGRLEVLLRSGRIARWEIRNLRRKIPGEGELMHQTLSAHVDLSNEEMLKWAKFHTDEVIAWLFYATEGEFSFAFAEEVSSPAGWEAIPLKEVVEKGVERACVMRDFFEGGPGPGMIPVVAAPDDEDLPAALEEDEWEMLAGVDGRKNLKDFIVSSPFPCYRSAELMGILFAKKLIVPGVVAEPVAELPASAAKEQAGAGSKILKRMFGGGKEPAAAALPSDVVGQYAVAANRLSAGIRERSTGTLQVIWDHILAEFPTARILRFEKGLFDPYSFGNQVAAWGNHHEYWEKVRHDCEEALIRYLAKTLDQIKAVEGVRKAEDTFARSVEDVESIEGLSVFDGI